MFVVHQYANELATEPVEILYSLSSDSASGKRSTRLV